MAPMAISTPLALRASPTRLLSRRSTICTTWYFFKVEREDTLSFFSEIYLNCPGGSLYSILAIYDCMSWIKPKVGTVCFGVVASQAAIILAGGEKGMRYAMPNARVMIHQPQGGSEGNVEEVRRQVGETIYARDKVDKMFAAFTGQTLDMVQQWTERDRFMSSSEAMDFGLVDALLETRY
uniref:ATP-dependent Clp protease proteolytic subunit n=1 Tax=Oryza meridionalis TaxID=40149 RepID=A0A0E0D240_9ORYZ